MSLVAGLMLAVAQPAAAQTTDPAPCPVQFAPGAGAAAGSYAPVTGAPPGNTQSPTTGALSVTSLREDDPTPTYDAPVRILLSGPYVDSDGGAIAYYCGRNGDSVTRPGDPLLQRPSPDNTHVYRQRGNVTIERFAVDNEGYKSLTRSATIFINSGPRATFTTSTVNPAVGVEMNFTSTASDDADPADPMAGIALVQWDFNGDGVYDREGTSVDFAYTDALDRTAVMQVTDRRGSKRRSTRRIFVGGPDPAPAPGPSASGSGTQVAPGGRAGQVAVLGATARGGACSNVIRGTSRADTLAGTAGGDRMLGLGGNDNLSGASGDDCLFGGIGADKLTGGSGRDTLVGGAGADRLTGGPGNDRLTGAAGADILAGGAGVNRYSAGGGNDRINSANGTKETVSCGGGGQDVVRADAVDRLRGCERVIRAQ